MHLYALFACIQEQCHRVNVSGIFPFVYLPTRPNAGGFPSKVQRLQKSHCFHEVDSVICTSQIASVCPFHLGCFEGVFASDAGSIEDLVKKLCRHDPSQRLPMKTLSCSCSLLNN